MDGDLRRDRDLALVVGAPRSGTTLTRLLLDAHPEIGCPSEAGLPGLMAHLLQAWGMVHADEDGVAPGDPAEGGRNREALASWQPPVEAGQGEGGDRLRRQMPSAARNWIVNTVQVLMAGYCELDGKRLYCDKSLDSIRYLEVVHELFPNARMVLVFRHVMDTVASGLEASPWGFQAYGYAPYVQASPGNSVAALASYWLDHVDRALAWETDHPDICHRVRYEDLVLRPEETVRNMQDFLGVSPNLSVLQAAFARPSPRGPGDYKVGHTTNVHTTSIGRGRRVPVALLPPPLMTALNEKLDVLGYAPINRAWNAAERSVDGAGKGFWAERLLETMTGVRLPHDSTLTGSFAVVSEDHGPLRWVIDPTTARVEQGDGEVAAVLIGTAEDLVLMLTGNENLGVLLRSGRVRYVVSVDEERSWRDPIHEADALVALLRAGLPESRGTEGSG